MADKEIIQMQLMLAKARKVARKARNGRR